jgi:hypothetical protein
MVLFNVSYQRIGIMMAERREEENSLQQERDVKLIARLLQFDVSESETRGPLRKVCYHGISRRRPLRRWSEIVKLGFKVH